jgi:hypothetical protein
MIGVAGLLKLLDVVSRLQAAPLECACASQEAGVPCPSSPLPQSSSPVLPPAHEDTKMQSVGQVPLTNRDRLLHLLGRLVERQLRPQALPPLASREEATYDPHG